MRSLPADNGDRFRTVAVNLKLGMLKVNLNMFTGDPGGPQAYLDPNSYYEGIDDGKYVKNERFGIKNDGDWAKIYHSYNGSTPDKYRDGVLTFQFGNFRIGRNSEGIRNAFQNQMAHDWLRHGTSPHFKILDIKPRWSIQFSDGNGNSNW